MPEFTSACQLCRWRAPLVQALAQCQARRRFGCSALFAVPVSQVTPLEGDEDTCRIVGRCSSRASRTRRTAQPRRQECEAAAGQERVWSWGQELGPGAGRCRAAAGGAGTVRGGSLQRRALPGHSAEAFEQAALLICKCGDILSSRTAAEAPLEAHGQMTSS